MNYLKKVILFLLTVKLNVLLVQNLSAQSKSECQQTFTKYVLGLGEYEVPKDGKHYFVHTVASTFPNKELKEYEPSAYSSENINVRVVIAKGKMFYYSNYIDFYQDNNDLFTVIHPQKLIIWRKPQAKEKQEQSIEFMPFRKQMLEELLFTSCVDVILDQNNFIGNTFDVGTNGSLVLNTFNNNYWDKYEGYDLNKDKIGDIPYRPVSMYSMIVEKYPPAMILFRSFITSLLDRTEKKTRSRTGCEMPANRADEFFPQ